MMTNDGHKCLRKAERGKRKCNEKVENGREEGKKTRRKRAAAEADPGSGGGRRRRAAEAGGGGGRQVFDAYAVARAGRWDPDHHAPARAWGWLV
jgi:hypothetical protein